MLMIERNPNKLEQKDEYHAYNLILFMIYLDICRYYFFSRPLLIDVVFPYWTFNVFGIIWNVCLVVGILCSLTPNGGLNQRF